MTKNSIVQFVCFQTEIDLDAFVLSWEQYAKSLNNDADVSLLQQHGVKTKFKYVSRHTSAKEDFHFVFVKGRKPEHFNDISVKVVQAGGYIPVQIENVKEARRNETKIMVFSNSIEDISIYKNLKPSLHLNIYEAYFESSSFSRVMEYFVADKDASTLLQALKDLALGDEIGMYKECVVQTA